MIIGFLATADAAATSAATAGRRRLWRRFAAAGYYCAAVLATVGGTAAAQAQAQAQPPPSAAPDGADLSLSLSSSPSPSLPSWSSCFTTTSASCGASSCRTFRSAYELQACIRAVQGKGRICMCPFEFGEDDYYDDDDAVEDAILEIRSGQDVTLECAVGVAGGSPKCIWNGSSSSSSSSSQPQRRPGRALIRVRSGANLTLAGNRATEIAGGRGPSRISVQSGARATVRGASFRQNAAVSGTTGEELEFVVNQTSVPEQRWRSRGNGVGGAIENTGGALSVHDCVFEDNAAELVGGAIYASGTAVVEDSSFVGNRARRGGAVYAEGASLRLVNNEFVDNSAAVRDDDVSADNVQVVRACDNDGYEGDTGLCQKPGDAPPPSSIPSTSGSGTRIRTTAAAWLPLSYPAFIVLAFVWTCG